MDTTERLPFHFPLSCIGEGNGNPLQCSCLENPRDGGALWAAISGVRWTQKVWNIVRVQHMLLLLLLLSRFSRVRLCATHRWQPTRLHRPWDSPGKSTGVGCHFLLQCMKVKSEREVAQSCPTLSYPMDCSLPGSSIHGIFQARVLEWGAIAFSGYYLTEPNL